MTGRDESGSAGPIIDVWANLWDASFFAAEPQLSELYRRLGLEARTKLAEEAVIAEAETAGLDRVVVSATAIANRPADNDGVAALVARRPDLLIGCAAVDPHHGMEAVRELRRAVDGLGLRGLKLFPYLHDRPPNDAIYYPLYAACIDLRIPVLILTGHTAVKAASEPGRPHYLDEVALHFPELTIIAGHAGFPWTQELLSLAWKHENVYVDTSGHRPKYFPAELTHFLNSYGRDKVMFGTGFPLMDHAGPLAEVEAMDLRPASRRAFLGGNAARVWGLDGR